MDFRPFLMWGLLISLIVFVLWILGKVTTSTLSGTKVKKGEEFKAIIENKEEYEALIYKTYVTRKELGELKDPLDIEWMDNYEYNHRLGRYANRK